MTTKKYTSIIAALASATLAAECGRREQPDDIAPAAVFLASDDARWIIGQVMIAARGKRA